ncbi:ninG protein [Massilia violaceinigra]|uniref:NinG protein n=1 Tax=Massilia violaceinigra TaxID=2045208 RepID=A0A2D2DSE0_9BURK|nr:recombination protein NinG [Massilia violaceinigra]ATQ77884.1 ninG protein [Massilia violaceinigra]
MTATFTPHPKPVREPKPPRGPRQRKCAVSACRTPFAPRSMTHKACSPDCAAALALATRQAAERKADRARKQAIKPRGKHMEETQAVFNAFIRERDRLAGYACISSGRPLDWSGNNVDAGHFRSRGSAPHLRFNEDNVHAQSKQENRYASGNAVDYRIGLIKRIGLAAVEALEADQAPRKWTIEELAAIKFEYRQKLKHLKETASC